MSRNDYQVRLSKDDTKNMFVFLLQTSCKLPLMIHWSQRHFVFYRCVAIFSGYVPEEDVYLSNTMCALQNLFSKEFFSRTMQHNKLFNVQKLEHSLSSVCQCFGSDATDRKASAFAALASNLRTGLLSNLDEKRYACVFGLC